MKIGINASFARKENTGIGQTAVNFIKELIKLNNLKSQISNLKINDINFVLYLEEDLPKEIKLPSNITKHIFLPFWKRDDLIRKIAWEKFLLPQKVRQDKCDIFFSLYQSPTIFKHGKSDPIHIMLVHDLIWEIFPEYVNNSRKRLYWNLVKRAIKKAEKIIAISCHTEKDLIKHLALDPTLITVAYLDVDEIYKKEVSVEASREMLQKYHLKPGYIYAGGGLEKRKNIEKLIQAYKYLLEKNKTSQLIEDFPDLVISGKLMPELAPLVTDVEKIIREENLTDHVKLLNFVEQKYLPALYQEAVMFIFPTLYEGFGLPVLEAMNQGTPVITAKNSSLPEVGRDGVLYCHTEDERELGQVIKNVLSNKDLRETLARRGKERVAYFSWEKFVEKFLNIAKEAVEKRN
ncbi:glycosyltransferase family 4 protein [Patescibacteria group bacterium]|nr:glycosyltransferase family 4 protein [Patescibacteria group bacterium]